MRRIIVFNRISLDGCFAGPDGDIDWFIHDPEVDAIAHRVFQADTLLLGRRTYQLFAGFWPGLAEDESAAPALRQTARELDALDKIVVSRSLGATRWINSSLLAGDLIEAMRGLRDIDGDDIAIFGSGSIVNQLTARGLIDEYLLVVTPVICGAGLRMFDSISLTRLKLLRTWTLDSGNVLLHYATATD